MEATNKRINYLTWVGWLLFFLLLFCRRCNPEPQIAEKIKVVTKEIKGKTIIKTNLHQNHPNFFQRIFLKLRL